MSRVTHPKGGLASHLKGVLQKGVLQTQIAPACQLGKEN